MQNQPLGQKSPAASDIRPLLWPQSAPYTQSIRRTIILSVAPPLPGLRASRPPPSASNRIPGSMTAMSAYCINSMAVTPQRQPQRPVLSRRSPFPESAGQATENTGQKLHAYQSGRTLIKAQTLATEKSAEPPPERSPNRQRLNKPTGRGGKISPVSPPPHLKPPTRPGVWPVQ